MTGGTTVEKQNFCTSSEGHIYVLYPTAETPKCNERWFHDVYALNPIKMHCFTLSSRNVPDGLMPIVLPIPFSYPHCK